MNRFGRLLLVISALAPVLGAFAVNEFSHGHTAMAAWFAVMGVLLVLVCLSSISACRRILQEEPLPITKVKSSDKEILSFLIVYLLPLFSQGVVSFKGDLFTAAYVMAVVILCVYHSDSFSFNPVLGSVGYHFYEVETSTGMSYLLLSRQVLRCQENKLRVVQLSDFIYLDLGRK